MFPNRASCSLRGLEELLSTKINWSLWIRHVNIAKNGFILLSCHLKVLKPVILQRQKIKGTCELQLP